METKLDTLARALSTYDGPPLRLMEVCGTHTHQLSHFGIPTLLSPAITLISGPGCPVCVTPAGYIDRAAALSLMPNTTVLSFGDMLRVPGSSTSLLEARAQGGSVGLIYSPMDALSQAEREPDRTFCVAAVGFETTLPLYGLLMKEARRRGLGNIRLLAAGRALVPALEWLCQESPDLGGFLGPGHVSAILGWGSYVPLCEAYVTPMAVAGFGYGHLIAALTDLVTQVRRGQHQVHNLYPSAVSREGNPAALSIINECFVRETAMWRGLGPIKNSGYRIAPAYAEFDAGLSPHAASSAEPPGCLCGKVITGQATPTQCGHFGRACTPIRPLGPCMVSSEGACGIWHATGRSR